MKRVFASVFALVLVLGLSSLCLAQDEAAPAAKTEKPEKAAKGERGEKAFKALDVNGTGKVTREEFMADAQKRAAVRWAKLDPSGKGYLTKEDFMAAKEKARAMHQNRKSKAAAPAPAE